MLYGWPAVHPPGPQQNDLDAALRRIAALGSEDNRDKPLALPMNCSPSSSSVSAACEDMLLRLLQPHPEQRMGFEQLFTHSCIDLPTQQWADSAAQSAESLAAAAYAGLDEVRVCARARACVALTPPHSLRSYCDAQPSHGGARLIAAKNAFLDAGHRYLVQSLTHTHTHTHTHF